MVPLLPLFRDRLLPAYGAAWPPGVLGVPGVVPSDGQYAAALAGASGLFFLGTGRMLAHVPPAVGWLALVGGCPACDDLRSAF